MLNQIIRFVEKDVDGCGTDAEVMILVRADLLRANEYRERLTKAIENIKEEWSEDGWDTDSIVQEACDRVFGVDVEYGGILPIMQIEF